MNAEKFWTGWLKISISLIIMVGITLIVMFNVGVSDVIDKRIDRVFLNGYRADPGIADMRAWIISITGAIMVGWGSTMLYLVHHPFRKKEKWAWKSIFYPALLWYILDTGISAYYGVWFNVGINTILFFQLMAPMLFLRSQFYHPKS